MRFGGGNRPYAPKSPDLAPENQFADAGSPVPTPENQLSALRYLKHLKLPVGDENQFCRGDGEDAFAPPA